MTQGDVRVAVRGAQVPLKGEAIQVAVTVPQGKDAQADALLSELLAGLDGPSNWLPAEAPEWLNLLGGVLGVGLVGLVGALVVGLVRVVTHFAKALSASFRRMKAASRREEKR